MIYVVNMLDDLSLDVSPAGHLERGMTVIIRCMVRYGPRDIDENREPSLTLTLDNEPALPTGQIYYERPADIQTKTLVIALKSSFP